MNPSSGRGLLIFAAVVVIIAGIKAAQELMVPFLLSAFLATIAATPVFWLHSRKVPMALSITAVMSAFIAVLVGVGLLVAQSANEFSVNQKKYQTSIENLQTDLVADAVGWVNETFEQEYEVPKLDSFLKPTTALQMVGNTLSGLGGVLSNGFLILLTVIFILSEAYSFPRKLADVLSNPDEDLPHFSRFAENVNRYIAIKTSVSIMTGLLIGIYLWFLKVDFPLLWGVLAFLLNYIPNIGSIIAAVPAVLLALVQLGPGYAVATAVGFVVTNVIMGNAVEPRFMGKGLGLSTLVVFLSLVFWGWMLGPVGMLLSVPLTMTAKIALEANPNTEWIAHLLGPEDAPEPEEKVDFGDDDDLPSPAA